jgi:DoxX-like family
MKTRNIGYWASTGVTGLAFLAGGLGDLVRSPAVVAGMTHLGYPAYFATILGAWKALGALALLVPRFPRLKEWAYAGIFFDLSGAALSRRRQDRHAVGPAGHRRDIVGAATRKPQAGDARSGTSRAWRVTHRCGPGTRGRIAGAWAQRRGHFFVPSPPRPPVPNSSSLWVGPGSIRRLLCPGS